MKSVKLFSDGSCLGNPGAGGWAYILQYGDAIKKASGAEAMTTNNQMELTAAIMGLSALKQPCRVELFTDSEYVVKAISSWLAKWVATDFKGKKNADLWRRYLAAAAPHEIKASWVKGHAGHPQNEECDAMARAAAEAIKG
ncbi:ribonuclease HI [Campylobacter gracilis]|uniref:Ribonuclease H n=2 Tax=Campylobacter TaxID=194 RepID=C8PI56_9BACT|nr:ribonuclease HI [Campylobacter gracilis]AKT91602.1 ribonuclease HI [Campylobacter gracilis]EEV17446.1 ribonuclease HI [Campylobacter gracilis RM3268]UEB46186.1 ribonuclease HI [Campylobacter gracilis]SUW77950.1 ribonuclease H [Campylobacter gracilis]